MAFVLFNHVNFLRGVAKQRRQMTCRVLHSDEEIAALFLVDIEFLFPKVRGLVVENLCQETAIAENVQAP